MTGRGETNYFYSIHKKTGTIEIIPKEKKLDDEYHHVFMSLFSDVTEKKKMEELAVMQRQFMDGCTEMFMSVSTCSIFRAL